MKVIAVTGNRGTGKTTLVERAIIILRARGYRVSVIKFAHHAFDIDLPGKDSRRHRDAGAREVLISSSNRWALVHELYGDVELDLTTALQEMIPVDFVIVEGYRRWPIPTVEIIHDHSLYQQNSHRNTIAIVTDLTLSTHVPRVELDDLDRIVDIMMNSAIEADRVAEFLHEDKNGPAV